MEEWKTGWIWRLSMGVVVAVAGGAVVTLSVAGAEQESNGRAIKVKNGFMVKGFGIRACDNSHRRYLA
jgi:hypothetical protein